ncbi:uncharacterized protein [Euphorbia lathyris]|uniref:uncharacterized protein n=1 Tax=Euphorbia lathyris TaxID=212925 RepID=UPI0033138FF5
MTLMSIFTHNISLNLQKPPPPLFNRRPPKLISSFNAPSRNRVFLSPRHTAYITPSQLFRTPLLRIRSYQRGDAESYEEADGNLDRQSRPAKDIFRNQRDNSTASGNLFLIILAIAVGVAAVYTISFGLKQNSLGSLFGVQCLTENAQSSVGFSFKFFGYRIILPDYAPGWIYFWLLMAAACGLFISEEALNVWVGITLSRMLSLDGTWQSFAGSFSKNAPYIISTILWVYWGVCISDMIPFYLGKLFRESGASDDICSKLGIGEEKVLSITRVVQNYGNLAGVVERLSLGVRNPTAFVAGTLGISPEYFFAGVCCGGLITLPLQLGIGFLLRERPVVALATVATVVGIWTVFPYALAAFTALFLYVRRRHST